VNGDGMDPNEREVIEALRAALDGEARAEASAPGLAAARRKALAGRTRRGHSWAWGFGGLATAAAGVLGLVLWLGGPHGPGPTASVPPMEDMELLASGEDVDFYADLDFYLWLAEDGGAG
jgi:hypothetical protein